MCNAVGTSRRKQDVKVSIKCLAEARWYLWHRKGEQGIFCKH